MYPGEPARVGILRLGRDKNNNQSLTVTNIDEVHEYASATI